MADEQGLHSHPILIPITVFQHLYFLGLSLSNFSSAAPQLQPVRPEVESDSHSPPLLSPVAGGLHMEGTLSAQSFIADKHED